MAVAVKFKDSSMERVSTRFHRKVQNSAARGGVIRADVAGHKAELPDRFGARSEVSCSAGQIVALDRDAFHLGFEAKCLASIDRTHKGSACGARKTIKDERRRLPLLAV